MADLTAIILTKNEEANLPNCMKGIAPIAKRIVVVDSGSTDATEEIAKSFGAEVYHHKAVNERGQFLYAKQFLFGLNETGIDTKWVLRIDADEWLTPEAAKELEEACDYYGREDIIKEQKEKGEEPVTGFVLRFDFEFMGKCLRHGGIYPFQKLLCFQYGKGTIEDRNMDEHIILSEGRSIIIQNESHHHAYTNLNAWIAKHNMYSDREADDYFAEKDGTVQSLLDERAKRKRKMKFNIYYKLPSGLRVWGYYIYRYYVKMGFLDGKEGKIFAYLHAYWYRYLVDAKIYEREHGANGR